MKLISAEHGKQIHWRESLKIEKEQLDAIKKDAKEKNDKKAAEAEKVELDLRKSNLEISLARDESKLRGVVQDMISNISAGDSSTVNVVRTLTEFLSKFFVSFLIQTSKKKERKKGRKMKM